jgi:hypothetical protein
MRHNYRFMHPSDPRILPGWAGFFRPGEGAVEICACGEMPEGEHFNTCRLEVRNYLKSLFFGSYDKQYWKQVFKDMEEKGIGSMRKPLQVIDSKNKALARSIVKQARFDARDAVHRRRLSSPINQYGFEIGHQIEAAILDASADKKCVDNWRWALKSNSPDRRRYRKAQQRGCCGSFDSEVKINGQTYLFGFNYGH